MDNGLRLEVGKFNQAMREMIGALGDTVAPQQIIDAEVSKIIESALAGTDTATVASIKFSMEATEWKTYDGKKYKLTNKYPNRVWRMIQQRLAASLRRKVAARGSAKRSWHALGLKVGYDVKAPAYVKSAAIPNHPASENVSVQRTKGANTYGLQITNASPILKWAKGRQAFFAAVAGRRKFFAQNLARGVFNKLASVAKKYPGFKIVIP